NGRLAEAPLRPVNGWQLPETTEADVAFALKCTRKPLPMPFDQRLDALAAMGKSASWIGEADYDLIIERTGTTRKYLRRSLGRINRRPAEIHRYAASLGEASARG